MRIYLDTSVFSALFDVRNPERQELTKEFFSKIDEYEVFISNLTRIEIDKTPDKDLREKMQEQVSEITIVPSTSAVQQLTEEYIRYEAISGNYIEDAYHIAIAVVNNLDIVASWNFRHIVRRKTKDIVSMVNGKNNYKHVEIMTPAELL
jgi:predicted nucleic acid-binding protein